MTEVFDAVRAAKLVESIVAHRDLEQLPGPAEGDAHKVCVIPSELSGAMQRLGEAFGRGSAK